MTPLTIYRGGYEPAKPGYVQSLWRGMIPVIEGRITMPAIVRAVGEKHGFTVDELMSPARPDRELNLARQEAMWIMRQVRLLDGRQRYSFPVIGAFFGRDHTTILSGARAHEKRLAEKAEAA